MNSRNQSTTILLITGDQADQHFVAQCLEGAAMKITLRTADMLLEGLQLLEQEREHIDLVLLDLNLPDVSGFKALTRYLAHYSNVPVIVISDVNNEIIGNQAVKAGAQDFLVKGQFDGKLLGRAIRYSLHRFAIQREYEEIARKLAVSQSRYVEAQQLAHFGNWEMDLVTNRMEWSEEMKRIFGLPPSKSDLSLSDYLEAVHVEDRPEVEAFFEEVMKRGETCQIVHRILIHGSKLKYVAIRARIHMPHQADTGKPVVLGVVQDVTERKLNEQLLIEKQVSRTVAQISRETLSELGFQVRTPMASVLNLLFLLGKTELSPQQQELMRALQVSVDDLLLAINNLLNLSVFADAIVSRNEVVEQEVNQLLQQIQQAFSLKAANARLQLEFRVAEDLPVRLSFDPALSLQVLYNLIDSIIHFAKQDSTLFVDVFHQIESADQQWLCFSVSVDHPMLDEQRLRQLVECEQMLESLDESSIQHSDSRAILSMAIGSRLARNLGGALQVCYAQKRSGLLDIQLKLPARVAIALRRFSGGKPEVPVRILLVEDHFLNQIATKQILTTWSPLISVDIAENGLVGYEKFCAHRYDLILMDIQMPEMNGIEAARKIRKISDVPIIALTAHSSRQEQEKCFEVGMNDYLTKPFQPEELYNRIMHLMSSMVRN